VAHARREPSCGPDCMHVHTHVLEERDAFLTDDRALLVMCRRLRDEHGFPLQAMGLQAYMLARP
jgi:hypothetical protein